jgi:hypothetical protein
MEQVISLGTMNRLTDEIERPIAALAVQGHGQAACAGTDSLWVAGIDHRVVPSS